MLFFLLFWSLNNRVTVSKTPHSHQPQNSDFSANKTCISVHMQFVSKTTSTIRLLFHYITKLLGCFSFKNRPHHTRDHLFFKTKSDLYVLMCKQVLVFFVLNKACKLERYIRIYKLAGHC